MAALRKLAGRIFPSEVAEACLHMPRGDFITAFGDAPLLVVQLPAGADELTAGLLGSSTVLGEHLGPSVDALGFATAHISSLPPRSSRRSEPPADGGLVAWLAAHVCFVAPLRKRAMEGKPFQERVSVGRARNNDIVLRDGSVSKFHAWFQRDDSDGLYLADGKSKNGTKVNGLRLMGASLVLVEAGDRLEFGSVHAILCTAAELKDAIEG